MFVCFGGKGAIRGIIALGCRDIVMNEVEVGIVKHIHGQTIWNLCFKRIVSVSSPGS